MKLREFSISAQVYSLLILYSLFLTLYTGFMGFHGDTWQIINLSHNKTFAESWKSIPPEFRIVEALFWIIEFKLVGLNSYLAHFVSLFIQATSVFLFGKALTRVFQGNRSLVSVSMMFAFFYPATGSLTYVVHTDNSRLSGVFFWASVLFFQQFYGAGGMRKRSLLLAGFSYIMSFLTYENFSLMLFSVPLFISDYSALSLHNMKKQYKRYVCLLGYLSFLFAAGWSIRYLLHSGAALGIQGGSILAKGKILLDYYRVSLLYLIEPVRELLSISETNIQSLVLGVLVSALVFFPFLGIFETRITSKEFLGPIVSIGLIVSLLGALPYLVAGYEASLGFTSHGRVLSSFSYGMALCCGSFTEYLRQKKATKALSFILMLLLPLLIAIHVSLAKDWQIAAAFQKKLWSSMLDCCPDVEDGTAFILLDAHTYTDRAVVAGGSVAIRDLARIMYSNPSVSAYFSYSKREGSSLEDYPPERVTVVSVNGVKPRSAPFLDLGKLIILMNEDSSFRLVDLSDKDDVLFKWDGAKTLNTNRNLIKPHRAENAFTEYLNELPSMVVPSPTKN